MLNFFDTKTHVNSGQFNRIIIIIIIIYAQCI